MNEIINIDSVDVYNKQFGLETLHPLVSVIDMNQATRLIGLKRFNYGIYALFLKMEKACNIKYGRQTYDYSLTEAFPDVTDAFSTENSYANLTGTYTSASTS